MYKRFCTFSTHPSTCTELTVPTCSNRFDVLPVEDTCDQQCKVTSFHPPSESLVDDPRSHCPGLTVPPCQAHPYPRQARQHLILRRTQLTPLRQPRQHPRLSPLIRHLAHQLPRLIRQHQEQDRHQSPGQTLQRGLEQTLITHPTEHPNPEILFS